MKENSLPDLGQAIPRKKFRAKIILPLVLFMAFCSLTQASYAQETRLNLKLENSTLLDALKKISTTTGLEFFYNAGQISTCEKRITSEFKNTPLNQALTSVLGNTPFTYKIEDKTIIIMLRPAEKQTTKIKLIELKGVVVDGETQETLRE